MWEGIEKLKNEATTTYRSGIVLDEDDIVDEGGTSLENKRKKVKVGGTGKKWRKAKDEC